MKRKIFIMIIAITLLFPVFFAFRSQPITYWLTGSDYRIKESLSQPALANSANLISLDFIEPDLSRMPFLLNLEGQHLFGGRPFSVEFYPGGAILTDKDDKVGVIDDTGQTIIPFDYDRIQYSDDTFMATASGKPTVYYAASGQPLFQTSQPLQTPFSDGLVYLTNGVHDTTGKMIFNPEAPILKGFKDGVAAAANGREIVVYRKDGYILARLPYKEVYDWIDGYVLAGEGDNRVLVNYDNEVLLRLRVEGDGQFVVTTPAGDNFAGLKYDQIELLEEDSLMLRHRLTYRYYDFSGNPLINPNIGLLEPFQDGYSLSQSGGQVQIYHQSGRLVKSVPGDYVADSLSEGTFVVARPSLNGQDSHYLCSITGKQLSYRPLNRIMPRRFGISVVFQADKGIGYLRDEPATEWVFVPSKLLQAGRWSLPIGAVITLLLYLFIRRYKL